MNKIETASRAMFTASTRRVALWPVVCADYLNV